jgi:hypothetical protein
LRHRLVHKDVNRASVDSKGDEGLCFDTLLQVLILNVLRSAPLVRSGQTEIMQFSV